MKFDLYFFGDRESLKNVLQARRGKLSGIATGTFYLQSRLGLGGFLALVAFAILGAGIWQLNQPNAGGQGSTSAMVATCFIVALCLLTIVLYGVTTRIVLFPDRVTRKTAFGSKEVRFAEVQEVQLRTQAETSKRSASEWMTLVSGGVSLEIGSSTLNYAGIRDRVLSQVPSARIVDQRSFRV